MGTYTACEIALNKAESNGFCFYLGGGQHHASYKKGMGFCLLNDLVISARKLIDKNKAKKVLIIDTDAHKGDGTSYLTYKDSSIKSLSIHMGSSWPLDTGKFENAKLSTSHYPSDWDIPIYKNTNHLYLKELAKHLDIALKEDFDLVIVAAGADPYYEDELASTDELALSLEVMLERDKLVYSKVKETRTPQAWLMAGGYGIQTWRVYYQFLDFMLKKPNLF
jgi:acetoin utilization deacetylase AcuC-like enzyme